MKIYISLYIGFLAALIFNIDFVPDMVTIRSSERENKASGTVIKKDNQPINILRKLVRHNVSFVNHKSILTLNDIPIASGINISDNPFAAYLNNFLTTADFSFTPNKACSGTAVQFTSTVTAGTAPFTYLWKFGDGGVANTSNPLHTFNIVGCGTAILSDTLIVMDANGISTTVVHSISILRAPDVQIKDHNQNSFPTLSNCNNSPSLANPNFTLTIDNNSPSKACIKTYSVDWGDLSPLTATTNPAFSLSHLYKQLGEFNLIITATDTSGCTNSITYPIYNQSNPAVGIDGPGGTSGCAPIGFWFKLKGFEANSPGTSYVWNFGDNTPTVVWTSPILIDSIYHVFTTSSCTQTANGNQFTVKVTAKNGCDSTSATVNNIKVYTKPDANFSAPTSGCTNQSISFINTSTAAFNQGSCNRTTTYVWNFGDASPLQTTTTATTVSHTYPLPGNYLVTLTASGSCGIDSISKSICISSPPTPRFTLKDTSGCSPFKVPATNTSDTASCPPTKYKWSISKYTAGYCGTTSSWIFAPLSTDSSVNPVFIFNNAGVYTISLNTTSPCGNTTAFTKTVIVKAKPLITFPADTTACGIPFSFNPRGPAPACDTTGVKSYLWTFAGGTPAMDTVLNPVSIRFNDTGRHLITFKTSNSCGDTTVSRVLTINLPPAITVPRDTSVCAGSASGAFAFTSNTTGVTYSWKNSNVSINLPATGSGNIGSFITTNSTASPITAIIKVSASKGVCTSPVDSFRITVNPTPAAPTAKGTVYYCQGDAAVPLTATAAPGDTLIWYSIAIGGVGSLVAPVPSTTTVGSTIYYVSQKNIITGCESSSRSKDTVTVSAKPKITASSFTNPLNCGSLDGTISLSGLTASTSYTVQFIKNGGTPVSNTIISSSAGIIIIKNLGAGTYSNVGVVANLCSSLAPGTFELTDPNAPAPPKAAIVAPVCTGNPINLTASTTLTGSVAFAWTGPNFTSSIQNPVINPATVTTGGTYYVVVTQNSCTSKPDSVVVTVVQTPAKPTTADSILLCGGDTLKLTSGNPDISIVYSWRGPNGFISNQPNPFIPNATSVNNGTYSVTAARATCISAAATSIVTIKPAITITGTSFANPSCGSINGTITLNGLTPNTSFTIQYLKNGTPASVPASSNAGGTIIMKDLEAGTYSNIVALTGGCSSNTVGPFTLQGNGSLTVSALANSPVCVGNALQLNASSTITGNINYTWTGPNGFTSYISNPLVPHVTQSDSGTYYVTAAIGGCSSTASINVTVLQKAIGGRTGGATTVCSGNNMGTITLSGYIGKIIRWESSVTNGAGWNIIANTTSSLQYMDLVGTTWFRALVQNEPCDPAYSDTAIITTNKNLEVAKFDPQSLSTCSHDTTIIFTATINNPDNVPLTFKWFVNDQIQGVSNPFSYHFKASLQSTASLMFTIKVLAENVSGCGDTSQAGKIIINPLPAASITVSPGLVQQQPNYSFTFKDTIGSGMNRIYAWDMGDGNRRSGQEIFYEYGDVGNYLVRLNVTDFSAGCSAKDSVRVIIIPVAGTLYVPNAFYPNSKKNELTTFKLAGTGLAKYHLQVFDTWGKLLFETTELNPDGSPKTAWNGTYSNNGAPLPQDAYVWKIVEARFKNGKNWEGMSYNGGPPRRFGTVTIFR